MPFKKPFDAYFEEIFRPGLELAGYSVERADDLYVSRPIMLDVQQSILRADLLLCEMSGRNPNVFYELGLAHAIGKPVILVSRDEGDIPFDLRHVRVLTYEPELPRWDVTLRDHIVHAAQQAFAGTAIWPPPLVPVASGIGMTVEDNADDQFPARPVNRIRGSVGRARLSLGLVQQCGACEQCIDPVQREDCGSGESARRRMPAAIQIEGSEA